MGGLSIPKFWLFRLPFNNHHACGSWAVVHHVHLHRGRGIESGFEMAMFFPFKGSKGSEGSSVYTLLRVLGSSALASNADIVVVREAPCTTGRRSKGPLQQQRVM